MSDQHEWEGERCRKLARASLRDARNPIAGLRARHTAAWLASEFCRKAGLPLEGQQVTARDWEASVELDPQTIESKLQAACALMAQRLEENDVRVVAKGAARRARWRAG